MEIALIHNNSLILGPYGFSVFRINSELEELEVSERINPRSHQDIPIHFSDGLTHLLPIEKVIPEHDSKYHSIGNFSWEIGEVDGVPVKVTLTYDIGERSLDEVKIARKQEVAPIRRQKENKIINLTVNDTLVQVLTTREERILLSTKLTSMPESCNYKFYNTWLEVTTADVQYVLTEVDKVIQDAFDWELSKLQEIDSCETIDEVYDVILREPIQNNISEE
jgi:hypothetical protein